MLRALWSTNVRDVGDVVEKFTATPPCRGNPPQRIVIVGAGAPSRSADIRGGVAT